MESSIIITGEKADALQGIIQQPTLPFVFGRLRQSAFLPSPTQLEIALLWWYLIALRRLLPLTVFPRAFIPTGYPTTPKVAGNVDLRCAPVYWFGRKVEVTLD